MSVEENKAIVRRYIEEFWNKGDLEVADELIAPEFKHGPDSEVSGPEDEKRLLTRLRTSIPPWNVTIKDIIAEGDQVMVHFTASGTHEAEWLGVAPTGKPYTRISNITIWRVFGGKIVGRRWVVWDSLAFLKQIGAHP